MTAPTLDVVITHLEMAVAPGGPAPPPPAMKLAVMRAEKISVGFYRYLYNTVGERWLWFERRKMSDADLAALLRDPAVSVFVLYAFGEPAGYVELDRSEKPDARIAYFGLMPHMIGQGLGRWFLHWGIVAGWTGDTRKLHVNTCTLDHPRALPLYQRLGFRPVRRERRLIADPRASGLFPAGP